MGVRRTCHLEFENSRPERRVHHQRFNVLVARHDLAQPFVDRLDEQDGAEPRPPIPVIDAWNAIAVQASAPLVCCGGVLARLTQEVPLSSDLAQLGGQLLDHLWTAVKCSGCIVQQSNRRPTRFDDHDQALDRISGRVELGLTGRNHADNGSNQCHARREPSHLPELTDI